MGMIGRGEAYDYRVPNAKQIGDPSMTMGYLVKVSAVLNGLVKGF